LNITYYAVCLYSLILKHLFRRDAYIWLNPIKIHNSLHYLPQVATVHRNGAVTGFISRCDIRNWIFICTRLTEVLTRQSLVIPETLMRHRHFQS